MPDMRFGKPSLNVSRPTGVSHSSAGSVASGSVAGGCVGRGAIVVGADVVVEAARVVTGDAAVVTAAGWVVVAIADGAGARVATAVVIGASVGPVATSSSSLHALMLTMASATMHTPRVEKLLMTV
jgi:hypothetical protein